MFQKVYVSSEIGERKPQASAFRAVANDIGVGPGKVLFFDDTLENVEGARSAGMAAVHVGSVADVTDALSRSHRENRD